MADIRSKIKSIRQLAPLPLIVEQILEVTSDPDTSARDLSTLIKKDQSLTAKVLKIANSAYYGFSRRVGNVDHAIVLLGFDEITNITLALCLIKYYPIEASPRFDRERFWTHCLGAAHVARSLCSLHPNLKLSDKDGYVIGLLHDFGKVVLDQHFPEEFREALDVAAEEHRSLHEVMHELHGIDHAEIGAMVADAWQLPDSLVRAVELHHRPEQSREGEKYIHLAHLANLLCHLYNIGDSGNPVTDKPCQMSLDLFGLNVEGLEFTWESLHLNPRAIKLFL